MTVVVAFTSDNGGLSTSEGSPTSNLPLRGGKGWLSKAAFGNLSRPLAGVTGLAPVCSSPVMSTDFFPTFVKAAAASRKA